MPDGTPVPVTVRGTLYPSTSAACRAFGVSTGTVNTHFKRWGHLDRLGLGTRPPAPVEVDGVAYPSRREAIRSLGIRSATLYRWLKTGRARDLSAIAETDAPAHERAA